MPIQVKMNAVFKKAKESKNRYRVIYGGAGSGKSHFIIGQETILNMLSDGHYHYMIVRKTGKTIKNSVFKLMKRQIEGLGLTKSFEINNTEKSIRCITGSDLITSGLDDVTKLKSVDGINRVVIEEAEELDEKDFRQLDLRLRGENKHGHQITLLFNPVSELHWLKKVFFDVGMEDSFILKTTYKDNKHLDAPYIKVLENLEREDYQHFRVYALGEWGSLGNLVFTNWEKRDLKEEITQPDGTKIRLCDTFDNIYNGLDFGFSIDPTVYLRVHLDTKKKEIFIFDEICEVEYHTDELAQDLKPIVKNELVNCDSAEPRTIAELRRHGINAVAVKKGPDSVLFGINWIRSHKVIIDAGCVNTIKEFSAYKWKEDKNGNVIKKPIEINNHSIDTLRYALERAMTSTSEGWGWKQ